MKKRNLIHFVELLLMIPLFFVFAFFMRLQNDLFFTFTVIFTAVAAIAQIVYLYIVGDSEKPRLCKLIPVDVSDVLFLYVLLQIGLSVIFLVLHNLGGFSPWTALIVYALLPTLTAALLFIPAPSDPPSPAATNERDDVSDKNLRYYANYLQRLCRKCEYAPLNSVMTDISQLMLRLDPAFSVQLQTLEDDVSSKCVKVENALLTGDHAKLPVLTRELEATLGYMQKRIADYRFTLTDEGFYAVNDEIAMHQIDLLLDKLGLEYEEDLPTAAAPLDSEFFYQKALRFASDEYRTLLEGYNQQIFERLEAEEQSRIARRNHRMRHLRFGCHVLSAMLTVCCLALPLLWHLAIQPQGFRYSVEEETGYLIITGYNPFYGDDLTVPSELVGKKVIAIGRDSLKDGTLTSLTLEEGIERLEFQSIRDNKSLTTLNLPRSLKEIGNYATYNLPLETVNYAGTAEEWDAVDIKTTGPGNDPITNITVNYGK